MNKFRTIFHPIIVFIGVQIAWIFLMAIWINWYLKNRQDFKELAKRLQPDLFASDLNWVVLLGGCFLMILILGGFYVIFVFWNKQAKLNRLQSNFVSSVTHELKSPLASLQLYLETLKYHEVSREEARDFLETMLNDTERLWALIENILQASQPDSRYLQNELQPVDLKPFLEEMVKSHARQFQERRCRVNLTAEEVPVIMLDKRALRMVFNNLIGNALRYSPSGSSLEIRMYRKNGWCHVAFQDQGIGLSEKERKRIFRKFYRAQNRDTQNIPGAGLGLYISREIVRNHGGQIKVSSEGPGRGCTFLVSLPLDGKRRAAWWSHLKTWWSGVYGVKEEAHPAG